MARRSVCLFSAAILGFSLVPSYTWADEVSETPANSVTTELVESSNDVQSPPVVETTETLIEEPKSDAEIAEANASESESALESEVLESSEETTLPGESSAELIGYSVAEASRTCDEQEPIEAEKQEEVKTEELAETEMLIEDTHTRTVKTALKNENDGKIVEHNKAITDENTKITDDYEFMPNFSNVKNIVIGGTKNYTSDGYSYVFDLDTEKPNTLTVTYKNVGTYKGKVIDMRITVKGWTALAGRQVLYINKENGITMRGIRDVLLNYAFLDNLTASPVKVSGFFNFTDIDFEQSIDLFNNNNIQNFYVTKNNQLFYKVHNDYIKIGEINNYNTNHFDMRYWLTYTYKNVSNFDVRYNQEYETDAVFNYSFKLPFAMDGILGGVDPTIPIDVEIPDEPTPEDNFGNTTETLNQRIAIETIKMNRTTQEEVSQQSIQTKQIPMAKMKQAELPSTNEQNSSILTIIGGACTLLSTALFLNKKKL